MARAPPSAPSSPYRKQSTFSHQPGRSTSCRDRLQSWPESLGPKVLARKSWLESPGSRSGSGGLDIVAQRFLLGLVFPDAPFDDIADGNQADNLVDLNH